MASYILDLVLLEGESPVRRTYGSARHASFGSAGASPSLPSPWKGEGVRGEGRTILPNATRLGRSLALHENHAHKCSRC
jgi:hypothetical protein